MAILTDEEIARLLAEPKYFPANPKLSLKPKANAQHEEAELVITAQSGEVFKVRIRRHRFNPLKFSIILLYLDRANKSWPRLMRCNGHHEHTNVLEGDRLESFHVHRATQRYMEAGLVEDGYADGAPYSTYDGALSHFFSVANCRRTQEHPTLFEDS